MDEKNDKFEITDEDTTETDFSEEDLESEDKDWKEEAKGLKGRTKRSATKLGKAKEIITNLEKEIVTLKPKEETEESTPQDKKGLDLPQKTYLLQKGIDEGFFDKVEEGLSDFGGDLERMISNPYFISEHKKFTEEKASREASPEGGGGAGADGGKKKAEHWVKAGGLPEPDGTDETIKLRGEIIKLRTDASKKLPQ